MKKNKVVLIYSGGLDSTVLLASLLASGDKVWALSINYGQKHSQELIHALEICNSLPVEDHKIINLSNLRPLLRGSSQTDPEIAVPHGHYEEESMKLTVVPNRNMIMLAIAGGWAISLKADSIAYAAHAGDHAIYSDCREEFVKPLSHALINADSHPVTIERPFIRMTKAEIVKEGQRVGAPMHNSYSCYEGKPYHCGKCGTCTERKEAFQLAGVPDLTPYV